MVIAVVLRHPQTYGAPKSERQPQIGERGLLGGLRNGSRRIQLPLYEELTLRASALDLFEYAFCLLLDPHKLCFSILSVGQESPVQPPIA